MTTPAWIQLEGTANTRDVGGLPTQDGGQVQPGRLIRSDNLISLTEDDVDHLVRERGLSDVVDLRKGIEVRFGGVGPLREREEVGYHHLSLFPESDTEVETALTWHNGARDEHDGNHWTSHYLGYLAQRPDSVSAALAVVRDARGAVLVHCAAGKDRTGTVTALALSVAGVDDATINADYCATGERIAGVVERMSRLPEYAERLRETTLDKHHPDPEAMPRLLAAVRREHGSVEQWLLHQGWDDAQVARLRARLTEE